MARHNLEAEPNHGEAGLKSGANAECSCAIEVGGIEAGTSEQILMSIFENKGLTGIKDAHIEKVTFTADDHSTAIITFSDSAGYCIIIYVLLSRVLHYNRAITRVPNLTQISK